MDSPLERMRPARKAAAPSTPTRSTARDIVQRKGDCRTDSAQTQAGSKARTSPREATAMAKSKAPPNSLTKNPDRQKEKARNKKPAARKLEAANAECCHSAGASMTARQTINWANDLGGRVQKRIPAASQKSPKDTQFVRRIGSTAGPNFKAAASSQ